MHHNGCKEFLLSYIRCCMRAFLFWRKTNNSDLDQRAHQTSPFQCARASWMPYGLSFKPNHHHQSLAAPVCVGGSSHWAFSQWEGDGKSHRTLTCLCNQSSEPVLCNSTLTAHASGSLGGGRAGEAEDRGFICTAV